MADQIEEMAKYEIMFCNLQEMEKNEHGQFIFDSRNRKESFNLPYILYEYKEWLLENKIVSNDGGHTSHNQQNN